MWYADKAALRTGYVQNTEWDNNNIGPYSFAAGFNAKASGTSSFSLGNQTVASANYSTALGVQTVASGEYSTAIGSFSSAEGIVSSALGLSTIAKGYGSTVVGLYNDSILLSNDVSPTATTPLFIVGNGNSPTARTNAMTVLKNGYVGIGKTPANKLDIGPGMVRIDGPDVPGNVALSLGGYGDLQVDAFGVPGGRFIVKENGNVGIDNPSPNFPLNFAPSLGDKISLWGNSGVHYGFGIQSNLLQIHTDLPASDIAFGYGSSAAFTETMRFKGNGAMAVNGNAGQPGQVLTSNGGTQAPQWKNGSKYFFFERAPGGVVNITTAYQDIAPIDNQSIILDFTATLIVTINVELFVNNGETNVQEPDFAFSLSGLLGYRTEGYAYMVPKPSTFISTQATITKFIPNVGPGTYTIDFVIRKLASPGSCSYSNAQVIIQAIPQ
jgi:hypothetical protein